MGVTQTESFDEIKPLIELCKAGKLFDVETWIKSGKPVNPPLPTKQRHKSPLEYAIDRGFHSLAEVLLKGGAEVTNTNRYNALEHAVRVHRLDLVELLLAHGADLHSVDIGAVFGTYDPQIMEFFIERGADVETGNPLAQAFCERIRPALRIYKRYQHRFHSFQEQANIALRYHCKKGNEKWIALMLWAGADSYAVGTSAAEDVGDDYLVYCALGFAAFYGHHEIFEMRRVRLDPEHPQAFAILTAASYSEKADLFTKLLALGFPVSDGQNGGSSLFRLLLLGISFQFSLYSPLQQKNIDTPRSREKLKMVHLIAKHGAKWIPKDDYEMNSFRREFLKMAPDYTAEFVWIMTKYRACEPELLSELVRTPSIRRHVGEQLPRIEELIGCGRVEAGRG
jgi:hypothetical protein